MHPKFTHRLALVALGLTACTATGGPTAKGSARPKASLGPSVVAPKASPTTTTSPSGPSPAPQASPATAGPSLPIRLGLALPASLVGAAKGRLAGEDGRVALEGDRLVALASGQIISNNSGAILSNHGASLISDQGGGLVGNHGASRRLMLNLGVTEDNLFPADRRFELWERLLIIDLADQLLKAYRLAGPKLGAWVPFTLSPELLEPPSGAELFRNFVAGQIDAAQGLPYTGLLQREGAGLHLWILRLPRAGATPAEGSPSVDLEASGAQAAIARLSSPPELRGVYAIERGAMRLEHLAGGGLRFEAGDRFLPDAQWTAKQKAIMGHQQPLARRRLGEFTLRPDGHVDVILSESVSYVLTPEGQAGPWAEVGVAGFGYVPPPQRDPGLATWVRFGAGLLGQPLPLQWVLGDQPASGPSAQVLAEYLSPAGEPLPQAPAELQSILPSWDPKLEAKIPAVPGVDEAPPDDPRLWPERPPAASLAL